MCYSPLGCRLEENRRSPPAPSQGWTSRETRYGRHGCLAIGPWRLNIFSFRHNSDVDITTWLVNRTWLNMCRAAYCSCLSLLEGPSSGTILGRKAALGRHTAAHKDDKMHVSDDPFCKSGSLLSRSRHQQVHTRFISVPGACACATAHAHDGCNRLAWPRGCQSCLC